MNQKSPNPPAWWTNARFGMFIHWGVFTVPAGVYKGKSVGGASEWLMHSAKIPVAEYKTYAKDFNPDAYDPDAWVQAALDAGMGYVVISAKHHDGFAMFDSKVSDWNVAAATPYGRDLLRPLVEACRRAGLPIGFYYSQAQDWINGGSCFGEKWDPAQERDFDEYLDHLAIPQIRELLTQYGPEVPAVLWWDTPAYITPERAGRIHAAVEALAPGIFQNDRLGGDFSGDFESPEQRIPVNRLTRPWETCMTTNESWGYHRDDHAWKSSGELIRQLCEVVALGGNYLLNIGPKPDGTIPEPSLQALKEVGLWMRVNGKAIRGASAGPFPHRLSWGVATTQGNTIFLLVDQWPESGTVFVPLQDIPVTAALLGSSGEPIPVESCEGGFLLSLAPELRDPSVTAIALTYETEPRLGNVPPRPRPPIIPQPADGTMILRAADSEIIGDHLALMSGTEPTLGCWSSMDSHPLWRVRLHRGGTYRVELNYAIPPHREGTLAHIDCDGTQVAFVASGTGGWGEFVRAEAGLITLSPSEELHIRVLPVRVPVGAVMNLRAVHFTPV